MEGYPVGTGSDKRDDIKRVKSIKGAELRGSSEWKEWQESERDGRMSVRESRRWVGDRVGGLWVLFGVARNKDSIHVKHSLSHKFLASDFIQIALELEQQ